MDFVVVIPSYKRAEKLKTHTLELLKGDIPSELIYIFVANEEEKETYIKECGDEYNYVVGKKGKAEIEECIKNYFDEGQLIAHFDDDVKLVYEVVLNEEGKTKRKTVESLLDFIDNAFKQMKLGDCELWGLEHPGNDYWTSTNKILKPRMLVNGQVFGNVNDKSLKYETLLDDVERSLHFHYKNGGRNLIMGRFMPLCGKNWSAGGLEGMRTKETFTESANRIAEKYPNTVKCVRELTKSKLCPIKIDWKPMRYKHFDCEILPYFAR